MPARIVVVHDEPEFIDQAVKALTRAGWEAVGFSDSMAAVHALDHADKIDLLITRVQLGAHKPHGVSLALMAKSKRPKIKVLFTALPEYEDQVKLLGEFLPLPIDPPQLLEAVERILK
jgi:DNA-binding NtrC family response regulator